MTDFELFLKYNMIYNQNDKKEQIISDLYYNTYNTNIKINKDANWLILLHGTYNCNANCIYCENHVLRETYNNAIIEEDIVRQIVRKLGCKIREITWHGGESLLLPESLLIALKEERDICGFDFKISLQTNGILLTEKKEQFLNSIGIHPGSSFDGLYNTIHRGEKSTEAINNLLNRGNPDGVAFIGVMTKDSIYSLIDNYEYCKSKGITNYQLCVVRENVVEADNPYLVKNDIAIEELIKYLKYWMYDTDNPIPEVYLMHWIGRLLGDEGWCESIQCIGKWLIIDPYGNIATCGMSPQEDNFENIRNIYDYKDLITNKKYIDTVIKQRQLVQKECNDCEFLKICYGGCMGLNFEQDKNYTKLNERYCDFTKRFLKEIYEVIKNIDYTDTDKYNPYFLSILRKNNYFSLDEIKKIEEDFKDNG